MSVTRRGFLQSVGVSGGAGAMLATMGALGLAPTAAPAAPARKVVILGGGVAG